MKILTTALYGKFAGSTLETAVNGRLFKGRAPEGAEYPYVVFFLVSDTPDWTFKNSFEYALVQFSLFSSASSSGEVEDMYTYLKTLYDDCSLTLAGSVLTWMKRQQATLTVEDHTTAAGTTEVWHYAVDYDILTET